MTIDQYITQFSNGLLTNVDAYLLLRCSFKYFYEECTKKKFYNLDPRSKEYDDYLMAHFRIQTTPSIRRKLKELSDSYENLMNQDTAEVDLNEEDEFPRIQEFYYYNPSTCE